MAVSRTQHTFLRSGQAVRSGGAGCLPGLCTRGSSRGRPDCMEGGVASLTHPTCLAQSTHSTLSTCKHQPQRVTAATPFRLSGL